MSNSLRCQASLSITNSRSSPKLMSIESVMLSSHLILCHPLRLLPLIPPSIRVFSNESTLRMRWPKYWSFSFNSIPSKEIPGAISFRMDWPDFLTVQGTLKSLLQNPSAMPFLSGAGPKAGHQQVCFAHLARQLERGWMAVARVALGKPRGPEQRWQCPSARA